MSSHEDSVGAFCYAGSISSLKLLGLMRKATKVLLTELVGQCNIFLAFKMMEPSLVISVYNAVQDKETLFLLPTCTAVWEIPSVLTCVLKIFYPYHIKVDEPEALSVLRSIKIIKNQ